MFQPLASPPVGSFYRVAHLVGYQGWVDFDFGYSTFSLVLLGLMRDRQITDQGQTNYPTRWDTLNINSWFCEDHVRREERDWQELLWRG